MPKRLGIFSIYDSQGVLDDATLATLLDLQTCLAYTVVTVNGALQQRYLDQLSSIADQIVIRPNTGFDAGAYKDVLFHHLPQNQLQQYDEFVLCNDTFYGPFVPFREIFSEMDSRQCDFWGLRFVHSVLVSHIQSYFYCFGAQVFHQEVLPYFCNHIRENASTINEVYARFEQGLFAHLAKTKYRYDTYSKGSVLATYGSCYQIMQEDHLPILKKKSFAPSLCVSENMIEALRYIHTYYHRPLHPILESARRKFGFSMTETQILAAPLQNVVRTCRDPGMIATKDSLLQFLAKFRGVYIYGSGQWGQILYAVYVEESGKMLGFVCSDKAHVPATGQVLGVPVHPLCDIHPDDDTGIVVALGADNTKSVRPLLSAFSPNQLYYLYD